MAKCYHIVRWNELFENRRTREVSNLQWVKIPNQHEGEGIVTLLEHRKGLAFYGAWCLLVQIASKSPKRGFLLKANGEPYTPETLASRLRSPVKIFKELIPLLLSKPISWLEEVDIEWQSSADVDGAQVPTPTAHGRRAGADVDGARAPIAVPPTSLPPYTPLSSPPRSDEKRKEPPYPPEGDGGSELRDTLAGIFHPSGGLTDSESRRLESAAIWLEGKGATPFEVARRVGNWPTCWGVPCTVKGLVEKWDTVAARGSLGGTPAAAPAQPKPQPKFKCGKCGREGFEGAFEYCGRCPANPMYCPGCIDSHECAATRTRKPTVPPTSAGALIPEVM